MSKEQELLKEIRYKSGKTKMKNKYKFVYQEPQMNAYSKENKRIDHKLAKSPVHNKIKNSNFLRKLVEEGEDPMQFNEIGQSMTPDINFVDSM